MTDEERAFTEWFAINYPGPHTVISDPLWHAPRIFRKAIEAERARSAKLVAAMQFAVEVASDVDDVLAVITLRRALAEHEATRD